MDFFLNIQRVIYFCIQWVTLTFAERFRLVFSLSGFANLSTKIATKQEFRLSSAENT